MRELLQRLIDRQDLNERDAGRLLAALTDASTPPAVAGALVAALQSKGVTAPELRGFALGMRALARRPVISAGAPTVDIVGTGGDRSGSVNMSTGSALLAAACGLRVVKHGNRSVSSRTGSADVLVALGVRIDGDADHARTCLREAGFAFCFAPRFHPALRHVADLRKRLGVPTLFNCLGPLANPAGARRQLLGVGRRDQLDLIAGALSRLGTEHALIVCGADGLDEVSLSAMTYVRQVRDGQINSLEWSPADFGLEPVRLDDLAAHDAAESASIIEAVLAGVNGPARRVVLANAAAALLAAEQVRTLREGVERAAAALDAGRARSVLRTLRALATQIAEQPGLDHRAGGE